MKVIQYFIDLSFSGLVQYINIIAASEATLKVCRSHLCFHCQTQNICLHSLSSSVFKFKILANHVMFMLNWNHFEFWLWMEHISLIPAKSKFNRGSMNFPFSWAFRHRNMYLYNRKFEYPSTPPRITTIWNGKIMDLILYYSGGNHPELNWCWCCCCWMMLSRIRMMCVWVCLWNFTFTEPCDYKKKI